MVKRMCAVCGVLSIAALGLLQASATMQDGQQPPNDASKVHVVAPGDFVLRVEREGRVESADKSKVRIIPETFTGPFEVVEVVKRNGRVKQGDVLVRIDSEPLDKELDSARMALDHARKRLEIAREEARIQHEDNATRIEQVEKARVKSEKELQIWEKYDGPDMLKGGELSMRQRENGLTDEKQELAQLEEMYKGTHLATETKDIVLERTRRNVKLQEDWLGISKDGNIVSVQYRYPQRDQDVRDTLRWAQLDEAHTRVTTSAADQRKAMDLEVAQRGVRDAEERFNKLDSDRQWLVIKAPADGIMTRIDLEPHDMVSARSTICEILNPAKLMVKIPIVAEDLRVIQPAASESERPSVVVMLPEYPEVKVSGTVQDIADLGVLADKSTQFPLTVGLTSNDPMLRIGLRCKLCASRTIPGTLSIPASAVKWENGQAWCNTRGAGGAAQKRTIVLGASSGENVAVISGLNAGDEVILE